VFLVEDDDELRELAREVIEDEGYSVLTARDGHEALHRMRGFTGRGVALIDLWLPRMDGWDVIATMKRDEKMRNIPVVVVSSQSGDVPGAERIITKPCMPEDLIRAVSDFCI
jgi:CheY-like chemotaxis protein